MQLTKVPLIGLSRYLTIIAVIESTKAIECAIINAILNVFNYTYIIKYQYINQT